MAQEKSAAKEQSMEEILQSIKRIIAEENDGSGEAASSGGGSGAADVLELTDFVDDATFNEEADAKPEPVKAKEPVKEVVKEVAVAPVISAPPAPAPAPAPKPAPAPVAKKPEVELGSSTLVAMPIEKNVPAEVPDVLKDIDSLLSDDTRKTSSAALKSLSEATKKPVQASVVAPTPALEFRSGQTVEDLVVEALRPMLKDWLDQNLTGIVEKLVEKEIKKLSS